MGERITHGISLTTPKFLQEPLSTFFTIYMTHLTTLVAFRLLVSEYLGRQILTFVSSRNHRISFFFRIPRTDFKLRERIYHPLFSYCIKISLRSIPHLVSLVKLESLLSATVQVPWKCKYE